MGLRLVSSPCVVSSAIHGQHPCLVLSFKNAYAVKRYLEIYGSWLVQEANLAKSKIKFSPGCRMLARKYVNNKLGLRVMGPGSIYLGNTFAFGRYKIEEFSHL